MQPPNVKSPAPLAGGNRAKSLSEIGNRESNLSYLRAQGPSLTEELVAATERAEDLLALSREHRRLQHRLRIAQLRFDLIGVDVDEQDALADEVALFRELCFGLAERSTLPERKVAA
jgi:hypothetical protein